MSESSEQPIIQSNPSDTDTKSSKPSLAPKLIAKGRQNPNHVRITEEGREIAKAIYHDAKSANNNNLEDVQKYARAEARKTTEELKKVRSAIRKEIAAQWKAEGRKPTQDKEAFKQALQQALIHSDEIDNLKAVRSMYKSVDARANMDSKYTASLPLQTQEELQAAIQDPKLTNASEAVSITGSLPEAYRDTDALAMRVLENPPQRPEYGVGNAFWDTVRLLDQPDVMYSPATHQFDTNDNTTQTVVAQAEVHDQQGKLINIWEKQGKFTNGKLDGTYVESLKTIGGKDVATVIVRYDVNGNAVSVIRRNYDDSGTPSGNTVLLYNYEDGIPVSVTERVIDKDGNRLRDVNKPLRPAGKDTDQTQPPISDIPTPETAAAAVPVPETGAAPMIKPAGEASTVAEASLQAAPENPAPAASPPPPETSINPQEQAEYEALAQREIELLNKMNQQGKVVIKAHSNGASSIDGGRGEAILRQRGEEQKANPPLPPYFQDKAFSILTSRTLDGRSPLSAELARNGIFETIVIQPLQKDVYQTVKVPDGKKYGLFQKYKEMQVKAGAEPVSMSSITPGADPEEAVGVYYSVSTSILGRRNPLLQGYDYKDMDGRDGAQLDFRMALPKSLAQEFSTALAQDPFLIRRLLDYQIQANYPDAHGEYKNPYAPDYNKKNPYLMRPKWETWDKITKDPQMLVVDRLSNPQAGTDAQTKAGTGFNPAEVVHPRKVVTRQKKNVVNAAVYKYINNLPSTT